MQGFACLSFFFDGRYRDSWRFDLKKEFSAINAVPLNQICSYKAQTGWTKAHVSTAVYRQRHVQGTLLQKLVSASGT